MATTSFALAAPTGGNAKGAWVDCGVLTTAQIIQAQSPDGIAITGIHVHAAASAPAQDSTVFIELKDGEADRGDGTLKRFARAAGNYAAVAIVHP